MLYSNSLQVANLAQISARLEQTSSAIAAWMEHTGLHRHASTAEKKRHLEMIRGRSSAHALAEAAAIDHMLDEEHALHGELVRALELHPAWVWVREIRPIPRLVAAQLLVRLDPLAIPSTSPLNFWNLCGLDTGLRFRLECPACELGVMTDSPEDVSLRHLRPGTLSFCEGLLAGTSRPAGTARPRPRGPDIEYNTVARAACFEVGHRLSTRQGAYRSFHNSSRAALSRANSRWDARRVGRFAMLQTEKLFLGHLWTAWRRALGLPCAPGFEGVGAEHPEYLDPWRMTADRVERTSTHEAALPPLGLGAAMGAPRADEDRR